jgi:hypothetical protein
MTWLQTQKLFPKNVWKPEEESETSELVAGLMDSIAETDAALADLKADAAEIREKYEGRLAIRYQELDRLIEKEALLNQETEAVIARARKLIGKSRPTSLDFVQIVEMSVYGNFDKDAILNFILRDYGWDEVRLTNGWKNIKIIQGDVSVRFF